MRDTTTLWLRSLFFIVTLLLIGLGYTTSAQEKKGVRVKTEDGGLIARIAPGEFLPISVKLANFGGGGTVDVTIHYQIFDDSKTILLTETEVIAVETTASFTKVIQMPYNTLPGRYTARSSITHEGQKVLATSNYQFTVERKIAGIFVGQFVIYGILTLLFFIEFIIMNRLFVKRRRVNRLALDTYPMGKAKE